VCARARARVCVCVCVYVCVCVCACACVCGGATFRSPNKQCIKGKSFGCSDPATPGGAATVWVTADCRGAFQCNGVPSVVCESWSNGKVECPCATTQVWARSATLNLSPGFASSLPPSPFLFSVRVRLMTQCTRFTRTSSLSHTHTHTHTHIYIYIYI
jgi:hypothetical protein